MEMYPGKQTFVDDFFIESMLGTRRVFNPSKKLTIENPIHTVLPEMPWEEGEAMGPIIYDENHQTFHMYYQGIEGRICVLTSAEGTKWVRPELGLVDFEGSKANNIMNWPNDCPAIGTILWDPHATDEIYRWKRIHHFPHQGVWQALHSKDGYNWQHYPPENHNHQKQFFGFGSPKETFGGPISPDASYVLYAQRGSSRRTRVLGRRDSNDSLNWSGMHTVIDQDLKDPLGTEFYSAGFDIANRTDGGLRIIMLNTYLTDLSEPYAIEDPENYWGESKGPTVISARIDGFVEPQLAASRNTVSWTRYRQPFIQRGQPSAWDWGQVYASGPVMHKGKLLFFYNGSNLTHNGRSPRPYEKAYATTVKRGIGLAMLRPDGYVSIEADSYASGRLTTHRFRQESGGKLTVNADASAGELRCEVLEDTGKPIPGFTVSDCDPIRCDTLKGNLSWNGVPGWPEVSQERQARYPDLPKSEFYIKLRFYIVSGTKLYAVTLNPPEVTMWQVKIKGHID
ncbi:TPA: hypothetical protein EYN98_19510 [Candidatus Poribacteria bacterium]|nr:hypothetical protein [Candidatus Poribacteria bacterium]HIA68189.1 hypothetical protein [Candidatus Poribacteria bacterium]HIB90206.1 hypothetical protein [Candidatus Poribacteria bacterium]HIB99470.1 hypothetical protein [Candidatus Poribacteria bacterium]HIN30119.1 hypothetical protein [Candidatus Poribacteria bacterium]